ncbi:site-specific integrase [Candidatus Poribacteria bacterium]|jgi:integrase|nr:site-specific integrase [Candidatus Poribacteria bacterium]
MPRTTRTPIRLLPHRATSGLFLCGDGTFVADIKPDTGRRIRRRLGSDASKALCLFEQLITTSGHHENPDLRTYLSSVFLPTQQPLKSYAFSAKCVKALVRFVAADAPGLCLADVNRSHVESLRAHYAHCSPKTLNLYTQKLKQALNYAVDTGLLDVNPIARVRQLPVDNRRVRFLSLDDFGRLMEAATNTEASALFLTIALTGLRPSNVRLLVADEVDGDIIRIPPQKMKNGRWGIIPIANAVQGLLQARDASPHFFPARGTCDRPKGMDNLSRSYRSIARRLDGLEWSTLYDLRHFFASQLAKHGATEQQIGRLLCHVGQSVTSRYIHHDIEDLRPFAEEHAERLSGAIAMRGPDG